MRLRWLITGANGGCSPHFARGHQRKTGADQSSKRIAAPCRSIRGAKIPPGKTKYFQIQKTSGAVQARA